MQSYYLVRFGQKALSFIVYSFCSSIFVTYCLIGPIMRKYCSLSLKALHNPNCRCMRISICLSSFISLLFLVSCAQRNVGDCSFDLSQEKSSLELYDYVAQADVIGLETSDACLIRSNPSKGIILSLINRHAGFFVSMKMEPSSARLIVLEEVPRSICTSLTLM